MGYTSLRIMLNHLVMLVVMMKAVVYHLVTTMTMKADHLVNLVRMILVVYRLVMPVVMVTMTMKAVVYHHLLLSPAQNLNKVNVV